MAYQHRNRRGDVYFLQAARTRTGKRRYDLGRRLTGESVDDVPAGYEVYVSPRYGQVYVRTARLTFISPVEREIVAEGIRCLSDVHHVIVDVEEHGLVVYVPTMSTDEIDDMVERVAGPGVLQVPRFREARDQFVRELEHVQALRFEVLDWEPRQFHVERWSSDGPDGEWIDLGGPASLSDLVDEFVAYLGEERFHELY